MLVTVKSTSQVWPASPSSPLPPVTCHCRPTTCLAFASDQLEKPESCYLTSVLELEGTETCLYAGKP
jgi:hypothetical protein